MRLTKKVRKSKLDKYCDEICNDYLNKNLSCEKLSKKYNCNVTTIYHFLRNHGVKIYNQITISKYEVGYKFNTWTIVGKQSTRLKTNNQKFNYYICKCSECGKTSLKSAGFITNNRQCWCQYLKHQKESVGQKHKNYNGYMEISGSYWRTLVHGAKIRNLEFSITKEYAWNLFIQQNKKCALSGIDIKFAEEATKRVEQQTASLDRIDSSKGYIENNIQWIHKVVNKIKQNLSENELIYWCGLIFKNRNQQV